MATFEPAVQKKTRNNTYLVYIRIVQNSRPEYIKTDMYVHENKVNEKKKITDKDILGKCLLKIRDYEKKINNLDTDTENWDVKQIKEFVTTDKQGISFTDYSEEYIAKLYNEGRDYTAQGYKSALASFRKFFGKDKDFQDLNSYDLGEWIDTLKGFKRCKEAYPKHIKAMFVAGRKKFNNQQKGIIKTANQPFEDVEIPKYDLPRRRAIGAISVKAICEATHSVEQAQKAIDVARIMTYFVGINTIDIFKMRTSNVIEGKLCYERSKTRGKRRDKAYIEVAIRPEIADLMEKYRNGDLLWDFGYKDSRNFNQYINKGLKKVCKALVIPDVDCYTFRHSWATIAHNKCGISIDTIALCLNHRSAHVVTAGYIDKDFSAIDIANEKVIDYIFKTEHTKSDGDTEVLLELNDSPKKKAA